MNNSILQLSHFKLSTNLNSHNVAAPVSSSKYEVSGFVKYKRGICGHAQRFIMVGATEALLKATRAGL